MNQPARWAIITSAVIVGFAALLQAAGVSLWQLLLIVAFALLVAIAVFGLLRLLGASRDRLRERTWRDVEGRYYAFAEVPLPIEDDGRHVWLSGDALLQVLRRRESHDVLAARMPGRWRRDGARLWLRVDAVINYLAHMPGRQDPRIQKFRRYLERDVLGPAAKRREVARTPPSTSV